MPDVRLPDGTIIRNVPEGTTKAELMQRLGRTPGFDMQAAEQVLPLAQAQARGSQLARPEPEFALHRQPSFGEAFGRAALSRFMNNVLNLPEALARSGGPGLMRGANQAAGPGLNMPESTDVFAAAQTARQLPGDLMQGNSTRLGDRFSQAQQQQISRDDALGEDRPGATGLGGVTGDIASLLGGRLPIRGAMTRSRRAAPPVPKADLPPGLRRQLDDITKRVVATHLPRGMARAAETGLEGAVLAVLDEGDPIQTAAFSAGSQAAGSLFLTLSKPLVTSKSGLLSTVALGTVGLQLFKEATPGGDDRILESIETSIFKVLPVVALGTLATAAGFGRAGGRFQENLPELADAITAIPRGAIVSLMKDLSKDAEAGNETTMRVLEQFTSDPEYFGPAAMRRLQRALNSEKVSVSAEIEKLMSNREFRRRLDELE